MKTIYITYKQNDVFKKAKINEDRYSQMVSDPTITQLVIYTSELMMENNYRAQCSKDGSCGSRGVIHG